MTLATALNIAIAAALILCALIYAGLCALKPYGSCRRCAGTGGRRGIIRTRDCTPCKRTGLRLRLGRRAWNRIQHTRTGR